MGVLTAAVAGLCFGLSLIVALGAQNAFVLRQGLRREYVGSVVAVCALSDAALIAAGVGGLGSVVDRVPTVLSGVRIVGSVFLLGCAVVALRRVMAPSALQPDARDGTLPRTHVVTTSVVLTWLNPHVYLDTVLLLGSVAATHGTERWWFGLGATTASVVWFGSLGYGARLLRPLFARASAWRVLDLLVAATMTTIAITLLT